MDKAVNGDFPKLLGKFCVANAWASEGVAGGDAVGRANARGGDGGERSAETVAGDVERQFVVDFSDSVSDSLFDEGVGLTEAGGDPGAALILVKANVDVGTDVLHVLLRAAESQNRVSAVARQKGLCSLVVEGSRKV